MGSKLLFFTVANRGYYKFAPIYIYFSLTNNNDACIEVCVESKDDFYLEHGKAMSWLEDKFPEKILIRESSWFGQVRPNTIRFIETPVTRDFDYVYIGDIDIIILDKNIGDIHLKNMHDFGLPFSNKIRPKTVNDRYPRLTGCHFAPVDVQYPVADFSDLDIVKLNDERVLHELLCRKGYKLPTGLKARPVHGIHVSPNRRIVNSDRVTWNVRDEKYKEKFLDHLNYSQCFRDFYFTLSVSSKAYLFLLEVFVCDEVEGFVEVLNKHLDGGWS